MVESFHWSTENIKPRRCTVVTLVDSSHIDIYNSMVVTIAITVVTSQLLSADIDIELTINNQYQLLRRFANMRVIKKQRTVLARKNIINYPLWLRPSIVDVNLLCKFADDTNLLVPANSDIDIVQ